MASFFRSAKERWLLNIHERDVPDVSTVPTVRTNPNDIERLTGIFFGRLGHHKNVVLDRYRYVQECISAWHERLLPIVRLEERFVTRAGLRSALAENAAPAATLNLLECNVADAADYLNVPRDLVTDIQSS